MRNSKRNILTIIGSVLSWFFGGLFIFIGFILLFSEFLSGFFLILTGLSVFPLFWAQVKGKWKITLKPVYKIILLIVFFIIALVVSPKNSSQLNSPTSQPAKKSVSQKIIPSPSPTSTPTASPTPSPTQTSTLISTNQTTPPLTVYNKNIGNNRVAAGEAQLILNAFDKSVPGLIKAVYVNLTPQDMGGNSDHDYEKSVLQDADITITVDPDIWANGMTDSLKKDFVAGLISTVKVNINIYPDITVSDGFRNVAEGAWNIWSGEANITLK
jgi:hypothetical protein